MAIRRGSARGVVAAAFVLMTGSCDAFTAVTAATHEVDELGFASALISLRNNGAVVVIGRLARSGVHLGIDRRVRAIVSASSGDVERVDLWHEAGGRGTAWKAYFSTAAFSVTTKSAVDIEAFERKVQAAGLVPVRLGLSNIYFVIVFEPLRVAQIAHELSRWPEMAIVELAQGIVYSSDVDRGIVAPLRLRYGAPRRSDGILQVAPGDTLRASYVNPGGDTLFATMLVPLPTMSICERCLVADIGLRQ